MLTGRQLASSVERRRQTTDVGTD